MVTVLYGLSVEQAWLFHPVTGAIVSFILIMVMLALVQEIRALTDVQSDTLFTKSALLDFTGVVGGGLVTYIVSVDLGLGAVTASGLIGLLGALIFPKQAVAIYCGSFVGMVCPTLLDNYFQVLLASVLGGIVYDLAAGVLQGFGGKLGTIACTGTVMVGLGFGCEFSVANLPCLSMSWQILLCATGAAVFAYWLSVGLGHGPVVGSSVVGLIGALLLPALSPEAGPLLAVVVMCASFTGMSSPSRIPNYFWMTLAGVVTGIIFIYSLPVLGGAGGKLGTTALGASMGTWMFRSLLSKLKPTI